MTSKHNCSFVFNLKDVEAVREGEEKSSNYQVIGQYDVFVYEEKPFETDFDLK